MIHVIVYLLSNETRGSGSVLTGEWLLDGTHAQVGRYIQDIFGSHLHAHLGHLVAISHDIGAVRSDSDLSVQIVT